MTDLAHDQQDGGGEIARQIIAMAESTGLPGPIRDDIDTTSLRRRFPHLATVTVKEVTIDGPHGGIPARLYRGETASATAIVWVHGGAFIGGDLDMPESHWVGMEMASRGFTTLALDYRKALKGVHHPVPSDDVLAGWLAASQGSDIWGSPVDSVHLGGASAGATLITVATQRALRDGLPLPASLILVYPLLHRSMPQATPEAAAAATTIPLEKRMSPAFLTAINDNYLGQSSPSVEPIGFPSDTGFESLPPILVINAEADELRASGEAFVDEVRAANGFVSASVEPGTLHGYLDEPGHPGALATINRIADWLSSTH
jgi:acetyl esterase/lipase